MIINTTSLRTLGVSFSALYSQGFGMAPSHWAQVAMEVPSTTGRNEYGWLEDVPGMREWIGDREIANLKASTYSIANRKFERTIGVKGDDIEDDNIGIYAPRFQMLGRTAGAHPNELTFEALKGGFNTNCYDGQFFFDTDHPVITPNGAVGSVANTDGGAGASWFLFDSSQVVKPIIFQKRKDYRFVSMQSPEDERVFMNDVFRFGVDARVNTGYGFWQTCWGSKQPLTPENFAKAFVALQEMKGNHGRPIGIMPDTLVIAPSLQSAARRILESELVDVGVSNEWKGSAKLLATPWLA